MKYIELFAIKSKSMLSLNAISMDCSCCCNLFVRILSFRNIVRKEREGYFPIRTGKWDEVYQIDCYKEQIDFIIECDVCGLFLLLQLILFFEECSRR